MVNAVSSGVSAAIITVFHPLGYAKVLIQIGHEPLVAEQSLDFFRRRQWYYPNIFRYVGHIKRKDGFKGLYNGLLPRIIEGMIGSYVTQAVTEKLKQKYPIQEKEQGSELVIFCRHFAIQTSQEVVAKTLAILCSQPFQVIALRTMAQFVGGETLYSNFNLYAAISEIYRNEGITGFYSGVVPRIFGDAVAIILIHLISDIINKYFIEEKEYQSYTAAACSLIISQFTYPFELVSRIMSVNNSGLAAASPPNMKSYVSWGDCWSHLRQLGQLKRGAGMFWRRAYVKQSITPIMPPIDTYSNRRVPAY